MKNKNTVVDLLEETLSVNRRLEYEIELRLERLKTQELKKRLVGLKITLGEDNDDNDK